LDFEGEVAVIVGDVPAGVAVADAAAYIRLLVLVNDISLRNLIPAELAKGFGFFHSKPPSAFSPAAATPDELGEYWRGAKVGLPLSVYLNGELFGRANAGEDMQFSFAELIAHAAKTRPLCAGTIIGSGTVSNRDLQVGESCIAERRMKEKIAGEIKTPFLKCGDTVRIEMRGGDGASIFGAIEQTVAAAANKKGNKR
jgi:fumarylacetoacetate (FAA) hydrolase